MILLSALWIMRHFENHSTFHSNRSWYPVQYVTFPVHRCGCDALWKVKLLNPLKWEYCNLLSVFMFCWATGFDTKWLPPCGSLVPWNLFHYYVENVAPHPMLRPLLPTGPLSEYSLSLSSGTLTFATQHTVNAKMLINHLTARRSDCSGL